MDRWRGSTELEWRWGWAGRSRWATNAWQQWRVLDLELDSYDNYDRPVHVWPTTVIQPFLQLWPRQWLRYRQHPTNTTTLHWVCTIFTHILLNTRTCTFTHTHTNVHTCTHNSPCLRKGYRLMSMMSLYMQYVNLLCTRTLVCFWPPGSNCSPSSSGLTVSVSYLHVYRYENATVMISFPSKAFLLAGNEVLRNSDKP